ncbi:unnamed protein product [Closterium sp. NIES-64]|nr:unnamed protein product [Closterium sp. NIES-64]
MVRIQLQENSRDRLPEGRADVESREEREHGGELGKKAAGRRESEQFSVMVQQARSSGNEGQTGEKQNRHSRSKSMGGSRGGTSHRRGVSMDASMHGAHARPATAAAPANADAAAAASASAAALLPSSRDPKGRLTQSASFGGRAAGSIAPSAASSLTHTRTFHGTSAATRAAASTAVSTATSAAAATAAGAGADAVATRAKALPPGLPASASRTCKPSGAHRRSASFGGHALQDRSGCVMGHRVVDTKAGKESGRELGACEQGQGGAGVSQGQASGSKGIRNSRTSSRKDKEGAIAAGSGQKLLNKSKAAAAGGAGGGGGEGGTVAVSRRRRLRQVFCMDAPTVTHGWCSDGEDVGAESDGGLSEGDEDGEGGDDGAAASRLGYTQHSHRPNQQQQQQQLRDIGAVTITRPTGGAESRRRPSTAPHVDHQLRRVYSQHNPDSSSAAHSAAQFAAPSTSSSPIKGSTAAKARRVPCQDGDSVAPEREKLRRVKSQQHGGEATEVVRRNTTGLGAPASAVRLPRSLTTHQPPSRFDEPQCMGQRAGGVSTRLPRSLTHQPSQPQSDGSHEVPVGAVSSRSFKSSRSADGSAKLRHAKSQQSNPAVVAQRQQQEEEEVEEEVEAGTGVGGNASGQLFRMLDALAKERPEDLAKLQRVVALHQQQLAGRAGRAGEGEGSEEEEEADGREGRRDGSSIRRRSKRCDGGKAVNNAAARDDADEDIVSGGDVHTDCKAAAHADVWAHEQEEAAAVTADSHPRDHVLGKDYSDIAASFVIIKKEVLGQGELGVVRRCVEVASGEVYACKTVEKKGIRTSEDADDVRRMLACLQAVRGHANVLTLKAVFEDAENIHVVMELCAGGELFDLIRRNGRQSEGVCALVCRGVVAALQHCHGQGIIHRDVKPENILLLHARPNSPVKLADFGVASAFKQGVPLSDIVGTREYMAPEVISGCYGPEADIWSTGVVLYIMLCGTPPFRPSANHSVTDVILKKPVRLRSERWKGVSEEAKDLVLRMLERCPAKRLTASQVLGTPRWEVVLGSYGWGIGGNRGFETDVGEGPTSIHGSESGREGGGDKV